MVAKRTGAVIIGSEGSANIARAEEVPEKQLIIVKGGAETVDVGRTLAAVVGACEQSVLPCWWR